MAASCFHCSTATVVGDWRVVTGHRVLAYCKSLMKVELGIHDEITVNNVFKSQQYMCRKGFRKLDAHFAERGAITKTMFVPLGCVCRRSKMEGRSKKQALFPKPVGRQPKTSLPFTKVRIMLFCSSFKLSYPYAAATLSTIASIPSISRLSVFSQPFDASRGWSREYYPPWNLIEPQL